MAGPTYPRLSPGYDMQGPGVSGTQPTVGGEQGSCILRSHAFMMAPSETENVFGWAPAAH